MYGLVNQAIRNLVIETKNEEAWDKIAAEANAPRDFVAMEYYPDALTYALVGAASNALGAPPEAILHEFGKHWVHFTTKEGYGAIMDLFGTDYKSCLMNLNDLHARMGMTMPKLSPPRFSFTELAANRYQIDYYSKRKGLSPMVAGLLDGLATRHGVQIEITIGETVGDANQSFIVVVKGA